MTSQNGWDIITIGELDKSPIPGTSIVPVPGVLRGDVATILHWVGVQFNARVQALYNPGCWGWNSPTPIPGTNIYSNHCSGTAVDFNAPSFPWKLYTMTPAQRQACREIVAQTEGVVVWGGDFPTFVDEMHFEIDATDAEVARIANKLKGGEEMFNEGDRANICGELYNHDPGQHKDVVGKPWKEAMYDIFGSAYYKQESRVNKGDVGNMSVAKDASGQKGKAWKQAAYDFLIPNQQVSEYVEAKVYVKKGE